MTNLQKKNQKEQKKGKNKFVNALAQL